MRFVVTIAVVLASAVAVLLVAQNVAMALDLAPAAYPAGVSRLG
jgi:hypothetical protein